MKHLNANQDDSASKEKHVPVYMVEDNKVCIKVGEIMHPSEEKHYIEWITLITDQGTYTKRLTPKDKPIVYFQLEEDEKIKEVLAYCNIHGLWKTTN